MQIRRALAVAAVAAPLLAATSPMPAPIEVRELIIRADVTEAKVKLGQAALCDGSVRLEPGEYNLKIVSMGDGSVRASFFDKSGRKAGEAHGIIAVLKQAHEGAPQALKGQNKAASEGSLPTESLSLNFSKAGFVPGSRANVKQQGQKLNLEILSSDRTRAILIGLLVPAVQKVRDAAGR